MRRQVDDPVTYMLVWVGLGVVLPLTPIFLGGDYRIYAADYN